MVECCAAAVLDSCLGPSAFGWQPSASMLPKNSTQGSCRVVGPTETIRCHAHHCPVQCAGPDPRTLEAQVVHIRLAVLPPHSTVQLQQHWLACRANAVHPPGKP
jgi:hypothetical protein